MSNKWGMVNDWGVQLKALRAENGMTQEELADLLGISRAVLSHMEIGRTQKLDPSIMLDIQRVFNLSPSELTMRFYGKTIDEITGRKRAVSAENSAAEFESVVKIPVVGRVPCGALNIRDEENLGYIVVPKSMLTGISLKGLYALIAEGDSLSGDNIADGDTLLFNINNTEIVKGKIYIVRHEGQTTAKHVYLENNQYILRSSNPDYNDIVIPCVENDCPVEIIGRVVKGLKEVNL